MAVYGVAAPVALERTAAGRDYRDGALAMMGSPCIQITRHIDAFPVWPGLRVEIADEVGGPCSAQLPAGVPKDQPGDGAPATAVEISRGQALDSAFSFAGDDEIATLRQIFFGVIGGLRASEHY